MLFADCTQAILETARTGWAVFRSEGVAAGETSVMEDIALSLGTPSDRDGGLWPVAERAAEGTFSVTRDPAGMHTDAQYYPDPEPSFLLFCVRAANCGGGLSRLLRASDVVDGLNTGGLSDSDVTMLRDRVWRWQVPAVFQERSGLAESPESQVLEEGETLRWRYNNLVSEGDEQSAVADRFHAYVESHPATQTLMLAPGEVLYCDNQRALHGRTAFSDPGRLLYRMRLW